LKDRNFQVHTHLLDHYSRIFTSTFPNQFDVLLVEIEGPVWYTIYHHFPVKGVSKQTPLFSSTNVIGGRTNMSDINIARGVEPTQHGKPHSKHIGSSVDS
jgi:hypothetical protein